MAGPPDPLADALRAQLEAAAEGFDWHEEAQLWDKLAEEIEELRGAGSAATRTEELGDLLFMAVNLARHLRVDPLAALRQANAKFRRRFAYVMQHAEGLPPVGHPQRLDAMEALWSEAKQREKPPGA